MFDTYRRLVGDVWRLALVFVVLAASFFAVGWVTATVVQQEEQPMVQEAAAPAPWLPAPGEQVTSETSGVPFTRGSYVSRFSADRDGDGELEQYIIIVGDGWLIEPVRKVPGWD